ncbi:MAG: hypothetical protein ING09_11225 [Roseomonas sp.]|jgi:hypothetical protein|nr:hypothetical protein [Roseomonas sp.]MCA3289116.1 hypothetical protein [Roseomonas sp.]MCA3293512.1 hypothetical protein [Roseomonas sp.]
MAGTAAYFFLGWGEFPFRSSWPRTDAASDLAWVGVGFAPASTLPAMEEVRLLDCFVAIFGSYRVIG